MIEKPRKWGPDFVHGTLETYFWYTQFFKVKRECPSFFFFDNILSDLSKNISVPIETNWFYWHQNRIIIIHFRSPYAVFPKKYNQCQIDMFEVSLIICNFGLIIIQWAHLYKVAVVPIFQLFLILFLEHHSSHRASTTDRKGLRDNQKVGTTATLWLLGFYRKFIKMRPLHSSYAHHGCVW